MLSPLFPSDICLNMMPLFHIGGIVRNLFSPILSGGSVISCSGFDPVLFWDILSVSPSGRSFTWYYAAPTMHHAIIQESDRRINETASLNAPVTIERVRDNNNVRSIRFIANAAGALLPILAEELKRIFPSAVILTSYGMTECMPISTPSQSYKMDPVGTSGLPTGPDIIITDEEHLGVLPVGEVAVILISLLF